MLLLVSCPSPRWASPNAARGGAPAAARRPGGRRRTPDGGRRGLVILGTSWNAISFSGLVSVPLSPSARRRCARPRGMLAVREEERPPDDHRRTAPQRQRPETDPARQPHALGRGSVATSPIIPGRALARCPASATAPTTCHPIRPEAINNPRSCLRSGLHVCVQGCRSPCRARCCTIWPAARERRAWCDLHSGAAHDRLCASVARLSRSDKRDRERGQVDVTMTRCFCGCTIS